MQEQQAGFQERGLSADFQFSMWKNSLVNGKVSGAGPIRRLSPQARLKVRKARMGKGQREVHICVYAGDRANSMGMN